MESEIKNKSAIAESHTDGSVSFAEVSDVANRWMLDFMFVSLCRQFKEEDFDKFNETLSTFQVFCSSLKGKGHYEKATICGFLTRVVHGNQLDAEFEEEACVTPLMSAAKVWSDLKYTVEDESLFQNITQLLLVQSVAVCLEKGQRSSASSALKWFIKNREFSQHKLIVKLSTIVTRRDSYHPFLVSFSFSRLLETTKSYLDAYLEKNPSDYILKEAIKMVRSSQRVPLEDKVPPESSLSEEADNSTENKKENKKKKAVCLRTKRKLLSTKNSDIWPVDSCKKSFVSLRRISPSKFLEVTSAKSVDTAKVKKTRKTPQKWTRELDKYLVIGVKRHGQGHWSRILMDFDFGGRTGTMLKDRWRTLTKTHKVG